MQMNEQIAKIGLYLSIILLLVGAGFSAYNQLLGEPQDPDFTLTCSNPQCDYTDTISYHSLQNLGQKQLETLEKENPEAYHLLFDEVANGKRAAGRTVIMSDNPSIPLEERIEEQKSRTEQIITLAWGSKEMDIPTRCPRCGQWTVFRSEL